MKKLMFAAGCAALSLAACAPVTIGGPPMQLSPEFVDEGRIDTITMSSEWLRAEDDFSDTFTEEVREELTQCATGHRRLNLRVHVYDLDRADRVETALRGEGQHYVSGLAEFTDPATGQVVGRYPINVWAQAGGPIRALLGDRQMIVAETFGRALCTQAFGRNPRGHPLLQSTLD